MNAKDSSKLSKDQFFKNLFDKKTTNIERELRDITNGSIEYVIDANPELLRNSIQSSRNEVNAIFFISSKHHINLWNSTRMQSYLSLQLDIINEKNLTFKRLFIVENSIMDDKENIDSILKVMKNQRKHKIIPSILKYSDAQGNLDEKDRVYIDSERLHIHEKKDEYGNYSVAKLLIDKNKNNILRYEHIFMVNVKNSTG